MKVKIKKTDGQSIFHFLRSALRDKFQFYCYEITSYISRILTCFRLDYFTLSSFIAMLSKAILHLHANPFDDRKILRMIPCFMLCMPYHISYSFGVIEGERKCGHQWQKQNCLSVFFLFSIQNYLRAIENRFFPFLNLSMSFLPCVYFFFMPWCAVFVIVVGNKTNNSIVKHVYQGISREKKTEFPFEFSIKKEEETRANVQLCEAMWNILWNVSYKMGSCQACSENSFSHYCHQQQQQQ